MASIRRTLSPVPRPGTRMNGEAYQVASPLSKSSSNSQNHTPQGGLYSSSPSLLEYALYRAQNFVLGLFSRRLSRPLDRAKLKSQIWQRALFHFFMCFVVGVFVGFTPFVSLNLSTNVPSKNQAFYFGLLQNSQDFDAQRNETLITGKLSVSENLTSDSVEPKDGISGVAVLNQSLGQDANLEFNKLLIIVTPTHATPLQTFYLNRLAHTLKLVPHPVLWIVVEMKSQSVETADLLRKTGIMYRHLVCSENSTGAKDTSAHMRNVALSHIEMHRLDGITYFADDDRIYTDDLFKHMRSIRRFGTWMVAMLGDNKNNIVLDGPICNGSLVIGWHTDDMSKRSQRFHADMSGFAFNSTIIWDPKRWQRSILDPIRQLVSVKEGFEASSFIEQVVEDESQMECFLSDSSKIMVWHYNVDLRPYPHDRAT